MADTGCGCPPTAGAGRVHHVFLNVKDIQRARDFYGWLLPALGYAERGDWGPVSGWISPSGSVWLKQADPAFAADEFHKDRVGLCEIAFAARTRDDIDALAAALRARGATVLHAPREYPEYVAGYYAVFFTDPDGIKLELVHIPDGG